MSSEYRSMRAELPAQVVDLVDHFRDPLKQIEFLYLLAQADILEPVQVDADTAARMVRPYAWFLDRVGTEGIKLTGAGYLPPPVVETAVAELDLAEEWYGKFNRESQTLPVLRLRESAMHLGLLRKYKNTLLATPRARDLRDNPLALWWHLAEHLPPPNLPAPETHASLLLLAAVAIGAQTDTEPLDYVARTMWEAGYHRSDDTPLTKWDIRSVTADTYVALIRLGALTKDLHGMAPDQPTPDGATFARAALLTWPTQTLQHPT